MLEVNVVKLGAKYPMHIKPTQVYIYVIQKIMLSFVPG